MSPGESLDTAPPTMYSGPMTDTTTQKLLTAQIIFHKSFDGSPHWNALDRDVAETWSFDNVELRQSDIEVAIKAYPNERLFDYEHDPAHLALVTVAVPQVTIDAWGRPRYRGFTTDVRRYPNGEMPVEGDPCVHCDGHPSAGHRWAPYLPSKDERYILCPVTILLSLTSHHPSHTLSP